jgi:hypothetical protein
MSGMTISNDNVRELKAGQLVRITRPALHNGAEGCTKSCCAGSTEERQVRRVTRYKDGRTRVTFGGPGGFAVAFPRSSEQLKLEIMA